MRSVYALLSVLVFAVAFGAQREWGELPSGFTWHEDADLRVALPIPDGWHIKKDQGEGTLALFVTQENIETGGEFHTGYSQSYLQNFSKRNSSNSLGFALAFIKTAQARAKEVLVEPSVKQVSLGVTSADIRLRNAEDTDVIQHLYLVANEKEDSLRITIFEAPEDQWEAAWKKGEVMLSRGQIWAPEKRPKKR